jgi:mono/diheme cytochrome c family protein
MRAVTVALTAAMCIAAADPNPLQARRAQTHAAPRVATVSPHQAVLQQYCISCHNDKLKTGGLTLDAVDLTRVDLHGEVLEKIVRKLRSGQMPPEGRPRPDSATLDDFVATLEAALDRAALATPRPGRVGPRRLNRTEYVNVIHDWLALDINGAEMLPSDMAGFGFDNNADALTITPGLMARYMSAATKISRMAVGSASNRPATKVYKVPFGSLQNARMGEDLPFGTRGGLAVRHTFPLDGEYVFKLRLKRDPTVQTILGIEEDEYRIELRLDHTLVNTFRIGGQVKGPDPGTLVAPTDDDIEGQRVHAYRMTADNELEFRAVVTSGSRLVSAAFSDLLPSALESGSRRRDSGPGLDSIQISGPFSGRAPEDTPSRRRIFVCRPTSGRDEESCARRVISTLARRAYRRPATEQDFKLLLDVFRAGRTEADFDTGIELVLEAILSSPKFLIRFEPEANGSQAEAPARSGDLELASRLSFFLWRSIPDDELIDVAARGKLRDAAVLVRQVTRMLTHRRATRFMHDFVEQWLQVRNIYQHEPDARLFGGFDPTLRDAMVRETKLFFESQVREDRPVQDLLRADYTYLNEALARHYGINGVYGSHFRRVQLNDDRRFGLLGQASMLTVTSYADRTSVVLRGKWVLDNLLGDPPPPPPPGVPPLKENTPGAKPAALRERMEQHRRNVVCSSCHVRMDPLGFALENFDAVGRWRATDAGAEINSTVVLSGKTVATPSEFRQALLEEGRGAFVRTVIEKLLIYALGRGLEYSDAPAVRQLARDVARDDYRWSSLVLGIVNSRPFQMRQMTNVPVTIAAKKTIARVP